MAFISSEGKNAETESLSAEQRKGSMKFSIFESIFYSVMSAAGDVFVPAALVFLGASSFYIGLLAALPQLLGAFAQSLALNAIRIVKSRRTLVFLVSLLHSLSWIFVIAVLLWPTELSIPLIILFFSLGAAASALGSPAWSSWISDIVPENERADFFARRNRIMQLTLFSATFIIGLVLRELQLRYEAAFAFSAIFAVAFLARLASAAMHLRVSDIKYEPQLMKEIRLKHLFLLPAYRNELWFLAFIALMNFTVQFASPFFTPYMLSELGYDAGMLGLMTAVAVFTKVAAYPYWGKMIDRFGNRTVLVATSLLAPFVPLLWLLSKDTAMIGLFQVFSGFVWSGYDLASFNYALALVGRELRPSFIAKYNQFNGIFYAAGSIAGGLFLTNFGGLSLFGFSGILLVFLISGFMRLATALIFTKKLASTSEIENTTGQRAMIFNLVAVYPMRGAVHEVLNGWNFTRKAVENHALLGKVLIKEGIKTTGELLESGKRKIAGRIGRKKRL
ncbi:MAG: MFS transporter [Candidatus Micrarchaeota archaeon]|nr:MFS transporter [Candidatus Micrarchaeota archaeon]